MNEYVKAQALVVENKSLEKVDAVKALKELESTPVPFINGDYVRLVVEKLEEIVASKKVVEKTKEVKVVKPTKKIEK